MAFGAGSVGHGGKSVTEYVRCVRGGPAGSLDPLASLSGAYSGTTTRSSASITVSGTGVTHYRYRLDGGDYSAVTSVNDKIELSSLAKGSHTLQVFGINSEGKLQANPTSSTWSVADAEVTTDDGTNPHTDPDAADADTDITYPEYMNGQYSETVDDELTRLGYAAMGGSLGNYSAWQDSVADATALANIKSNDSTNIATGLNALSESGSVDRVLTGMVNASCENLTGGYALFVRNTTNLARTYQVENLRYAKLHDGTVTLVELATSEFDNTVTADIYVYLRDANGNVVTDSFTGVASVNVWVKDNRIYDAIGTAGKVADPGFLSSAASSSSSSTGCMMNPAAGFGLEWLLVFLAPVAGWMRWRGRMRG
ncbi:MAG: hypothetical protein ACOCVM_06100 [Desulfovibrionaceae bacterium]